MSLPKWIKPSGSPPPHTQMPSSSFIGFWYTQYMVLKVITGFQEAIIKYIKETMHWNENSLQKFVGKFSHALHLWHDIHMWRVILAHACLNISLSWCFNSCSYLLSLSIVTTCTPTSDKLPKKKCCNIKFADLGRQWTRVVCIQLDIKVRHSSFWYELFMGLRSLTYDRTME